MRHRSGEDVRLFRGTHPRFRRRVAAPPAHRPAGLFIAAPPGCAHASGGGRRRVRQAGGVGQGAPLRRFQYAPVPDRAAPKLRAPAALRKPAPVFPRPCGHDHGGAGGEYAHGGRGLARRLRPRLLPPARHRDPGVVAAALRSAGRGVSGRSAVCLPERVPRAHRGGARRRQVGDRRRVDPAPSRRDAGRHGDFQRPPPAGNGGGRADRALPRRVVRDLSFGGEIGLP